jgi:hypothetical protein
MRRSVQGALGLVVVGAALTSAFVLPGRVEGRSAASPASYLSCGSYWNRNAPVSKAERRVNACIVKASRDGRHARVVVALTTIEGDPIVNYVFVRARRDVLVVVDSTRDAFGARRWERFRCTGLVVVDGRLGWTDCSSAGTGKPAWLRPFKLRG